MAGVQWLGAMVPRRVTETWEDIDGDTGGPVPSACPTPVVPMSPCPSSSSLVLALPPIPAVACVPLFPLVPAVPLSPPCVSPRVCPVLPPLVPAVPTGG